LRKPLEGQAWLPRFLQRILIAVSMGCVAVHAQGPVIINRPVAELGAPEERDDSPIASFWLMPTMPREDVVLPRPAFGDVIGVDFQQEWDRQVGEPLEAMRVPVPSDQVPRTSPLELARPPLSTLPTFNLNNEPPTPAPVLSLDVEQAPAFTIELLPLEPTQATRPLMMATPLVVSPGYPNLAVPSKSDFQIENEAMMQERARQEAIQRASLTRRWPPANPAWSTPPQERRPSAQVITSATPRPRRGVYDILMWPLQRVASLVRSTDGSKPGHGAGFRRIAE